MNRIHQAVNELNKLKRLNKHDRKLFIKTCDKTCIIRICECIRNVLNTNVRIKEAHLKKLARHKRTLRELSSKRLSIVKRRKLLQKGGGLLGTLLPIIIPAVASLIAGFIPQDNGSR
jgi:hypothetical protein